MFTACKISNKSNKRLLRYCTFIFSMPCRIASVTSYLSENEAKNLQNGDIHLAQIPDFEIGYLENHLTHSGQWWLIFLHFSRPFFCAKLLFQPEVPFKSEKENCHCRTTRILLLSYWIFSMLHCFRAIKLNLLPTTPFLFLVYMDGTRLTFGKLFVRKQYNILVFLSFQRKAWQGR